MIETITSGDSQVIICRPNKSLSWRQAKLFLLLVAGWNLCISLGFLWAGAWPVLPFMGLEILCLGAALYYVQWKLSHQEVIRISAVDIAIEYGLYWPKIRHLWPREQVRFSLECGSATRDPPTMTIVLLQGRRSFAVGKNLGQEDIQKLVGLLKEAQLPVRTAETVRLPM